MSSLESVPALDSTPAGEPIVLTFADGLVGLPALVRHELRPIPDTELLEMVSLDDPTMGFVIARAEDVRPGMTDDLRERGLVGGGESLVVLLAVHGEPPSVTANLAGPIAIDRDALAGRQLVLEDPAYGLREPIATAL